MNGSKRFFMGLVWGGMLIAVVGCASMRPGYEQPSVILTAFKAIPGEAGVPGFEVGLRILNPNPSELHLSGVSYTISLQGHDLVKGVGNDLPVIAAYGEGLVTLTAYPKLLAGIGFLMDMVNSPEETFEYEFTAKLDLAGLQPSIRVSETGQLDLASGRSR